MPASARLVFIALSLVAIALGMTLPNAEQEETIKGPRASELANSILQFHGSSLLRTPFLPDPDTKLLISMHHQIGTPPNGGIIRDLSGNGNHAKVYGSPKFIRHAIGCMNALEFAEPDKLIVAHSASLNINHQITIEAWMQASTDTGYLLLKKGAYGFPKFLGNDVVFAYLHFLNLRGYHNFLLPQKTATDGGWHYFALTYDGFVIRHYLDGVLTKTMGHSKDTIQSSGSHISIGHSEGWHDSNRKNFKGKMASLRISDRARSPDEITDAFEIGTSLLQQKC